MPSKIKIIWNYFKDSWEGDDGKFSLKRLSQYAFLGLILFIVVTNNVTSQWSFYTLLTIATLYSLTSLIITIPQLIRMIKEYGSIKSGFNLPNNTPGLDEINNKEDLNK